MWPEQGGLRKQRLRANRALPPPLANIPRHEAAWAAAGPALKTVRLTRVRGQAPLKNFFLILVIEFVSVLIIVKLTTVPEFPCWLLSGELSSLDWRLLQEIQESPRSRRLGFSLHPGSHPELCITNSRQTRHVSANERLHLRLLANQQWRDHSNYHQDRQQIKGFRGLLIPVRRLESHWCAASDTFPEQEASSSAIRCSTHSWSVFSSGSSISVVMCKECTMPPKMWGCQFWEKTRT